MQGITEVLSLQIQLLFMVGLFSLFFHLTPVLCISKKGFKVLNVEVLLFFLVSLLLYSCTGDDDAVCALVRS